MSNGGSTPSQYGIPEGATDLQDLIEYRNMNFALGNIFKAAYRIGTKNDDLYEINKILWFANRLKQQYLLDEIVKESEEMGLYDNVGRVQTTTDKSMGDAKVDT